MKLYLGSLTIQYRTLTTGPPRKPKSLISKADRSARADGGMKRVQNVLSSEIHEFSLYTCKIKQDAKGRMNLWMERWLLRGGSFSSCHK